MANESESTRQELEKFIMEQLDNNSGGMKYMDLLSQVVQSPHRNQADKLQDIISNMSNVKILEYTWHRMRRVKMFIYTP